MMKRISIKSMILRNFKGIAQLEVDFGEDTSIMGRNGTGKTTILDAFTWVLFDKDGRDSSKFEVATTDKEGNFIPRLVHEVTLILDVDGREMRLTKTRYDNWVKQRGTTTERFSGWKTEYMIDSVPMREKDYQEKVAQICDYDTFKLATIPGYLMTWKTDKRRELLLNMAGGDLTPEEIIGNDKDLQSLIKTLQNKTFEEQNMQIKAEIKRLKKERDELEPQLRLRANDIRHDLPSLEEIQREIKEKENAIKDIDYQICERTSAVTAAENMRNDIRRKLLALRKDLVDKVERSRQRLQNKISSQQRMKDDLEFNLQKKKAELVRLQQRSNDLLEFIEKHRQIRENLIAEFKAIQAEKFRPYCPTCGQPLQGDSKVQLKTSFYDLKEKKKDEINRRGQNNNSETERYQNENARVLGMLTNVRSEIKTVEEQLAAIGAVNAVIPSTETIISSSVELTNLHNEIKDLESQGQSYNIEKVDISDLQEQQKIIRESLSTLNQTLSEINLNNRLKNNMDAMDQRFKQICSLIANAELLEDKLNSFSRRRVELLEKKINSMFSMVKFKLFKEQVNGGIDEIAEAYVDGVPYSTNLNTGRKINAGIDICNAISRYYGIEAPVFVDNAEAANDLIPSLSQMVRLIVTEDDNLKITINKD